MSNDSGDASNVEAGDAALDGMSDADDGVPDH